MEEWCGVAQSSSCVYPDCGGLEKVERLLIELRPCNCFLTVRQNVQLPEALYMLE